MRFLNCFILIVSLLQIGCGSSISDFSPTSSSGSLSISETAPAATRLGFLSQPTRAGVAFSSFQVGVFDQNGDLVSVNGVEIQLSSPDVTLSGETRGVTFSGAADFDTVFTEQAGMVTLVAKAPGLQEARSTRFVVGPNDPDNFRLNFQPQDLQVGESFNFSLVVTDRFGNPIPGLEITVEVLEVVLDQQLQTDGSTTATTNAEGLAVFDSFSALESRTAFLRLKGSGLQADSGSFNIYQPSVLFENWRVAAPSLNLIEGFAFDGSRYVAVGLAGAAYTSDDGENFEFQRTDTFSDLKQVEFGAGLFVAVGVSGTILTSVDGVLWTARDSTVTEDLNDLTFGMTNSGEQFVAVGDDGTIVTSPNGVDWTRQDIGRTNDLDSVGFGIDLFVSFLTLSNQGRLNSANGVDWNLGRSPGGAELNDITYGPGGFVAVGDGATIWHSLDGSDWTDVSTGTRDYRGVAYHNDHYYILGAAQGEVLVSSDGRTWSVETTDFSLGAFCLESHGSLLLAGSSGIWSSVDGLVWTRRLRSLNSLSDVVYTGEEWIGVGTREIAYSPNGEKWTAIPGDFPQLADMTQGPQHLVAVGQAGALLTTTDRRSWTVIGPITNRDLRGVAYGADRYVAVGQSGTILTSDAGAASWSGIDTGGQSYEDVAFGDGLFVAVDSNGRIHSSPDGADWTTRVDSVATNDFRGLDFSNGMFVVVGDEGLLATSTDGINWNVSSVGSDVDLLGVGFYDGVWTAVGRSGALLTSPDAVNWMTRDSGTTIGSLFGVAGANGKVVVVGTQPSVLISP